MTTKSPKKKTYKISEVADMFGIHPDTLRNWEKDGVVVPERIGKRGDRRYTPEQVKKIQDDGLVTSMVKKTVGKKKDYALYSKDRLIEELTQLKKQKKFGLVWEDKMEEVVERCKTEAPILKHIKDKTIKTDKEKPNNILIEGDNYHSLQVLNYTHKGKVDVIYIDPPYNTGARDWKYNNDYVDSEDGYRHSKWISMMEKRLRLAKNLLKKDSVIACAIDDYEIFSLLGLFNNLNLKILGIVCIVNKAEGRNQKKYFTGGFEYTVFVTNGTPKFRGLKKEEKDSECSWVGFHRRNPIENPEKSNRWYPIYITKYNKITLNKSLCVHEIFPINSDGKKKIWGWKKDRFEDVVKKDPGFFKVELSSNSKQKFKILHKRYDVDREKPKSYWINKKYNAFSYGTKLLSEIFGSNKKHFDFPKSLYSVVDCIDLFTPKDGIVLDFFAGSGTTGHAVLELNKEDGGNRKFILCTNNEFGPDEEKSILKKYKITKEMIDVEKGKESTEYAKLEQEYGICSTATYPRIQKVIKGYKKNGDGEKIEGLGGNLEYLKTEFVNIENISKVSDKKKLEFTHEAGEMIALKENCFQEVAKNKHYQVFTDGKDKYVGIYFRESTEKLVELEGKVLDKDEVKLYIFSHSGGSDWKNDYEDRKNVVVEDIPEPILKIYKKLNS